MRTGSRRTAIVPMTSRMEPEPFRSGPRSWQARIGVALSLSALGFAIASLLGPQGGACPPPEGSATLDLTPLILFALATSAVVLDIGAARRVDPVWGRIGLAIVALASILGIWAAAGGFFRAGCS
jgi:hypothetical protein